ncbi:MAG: CHASE domain-containing protein [Ignavibacteria bacterium]|nr:CHASE domain-containing protein [Ignavibacteria bacterium]
MSSLKFDATNRQAKRLPTSLIKAWTRNRAILPLLVLITCLIISYLYWNAANTSRENEIRTYFEYRARDVKVRIEQRIIGHEEILRSTRGLFNASGKVNRSEFRLFNNSLSLDENYPGVQGVGFSSIIPSEQIKEHITDIRAEGFSAYKIWPEGNRETYTSIIFLEPFTGLNLRAFGYDMFSEPVRRKAMERARDSNETVISEKVNLVQETGRAVQAGFLLYLPVYRNGTPHTTLIERRTNIIGWVYSPFRMGDFMEGLFGERAADLDVEIFDGKNILNETKMYDSKTHMMLIDQPLVLRKEIDFHGHKWTVLVKSTPQLEARIGFDTSSIILIVGLSISLLLTIITWLLVNRRIRAIIADTERKREELIIQQQNDQLQELNATKDKFFSIIAHDLRSPFQGFLSMTEMMVENIGDFSEEELVKYLGELNKSTQNLYKLLQNLLDWAQLKKGSFDFTPKEFSLSATVSACIEHINKRAIQKGITIITEVAEDQKVFVDERMINSIFGNLLSNAVKFTRSEGKVTVKANNLSNGMVEISVEDSGVGMSERTLNKLFKIDEKVGSKGTDGELSTGLGLLLCKEFIEKHSGKIWVESEEGKGSTFNFTLPGNENVFTSRTILY